MEGFIYEMAAGAGQALIRPWLIAIAGIASVAVLSGGAGRIAIAIENRLATPPSGESTTAPRSTISTGGE
mgnify:CR=1 FL=1